MQTEYTAVIRKRGKWYIGFVEEVPGVNSQARTLPELRRNLREALRLILQAYRGLAAQELRGSFRREPIGLDVKR
jgi:predicted RNase H-like HicB family nuclease